MNYLQVEIQSVDPSQQEIFIALLDQIGYEGFEENENFLRAFIVTEKFDEQELITVLKEIPYQFSTIEEKNWNKEWESNFQPVVIDDFCAIRADFHQPIKNVLHEIIITPKMSFGTGHHPTTEMMIRMMSEIDFNNKSVFDFGTGTGVLSILAEKLGAEKIIAIDIDDWSFENAQENLRKNNCSRIDLVKTSEIPIGKFHIILANITRDVIVNNFSQLANDLEKSGSLIVSGILTGDEIEIAGLAQTRKLTIVNKKEIGDWISLRLQYEQGIINELN
jgi:ribosomal protein L11 methyltransferase